MAPQQQQQQQQQPQLEVEEVERRLMMRPGDGSSWRRSKSRY